MSILIRGIEMPKNCAECRFCVNGFTDDAPMYECACETYENVSVLVDDHGKPFDFRPDWCPLIEVQSPHGRLIDADTLEEILTVAIRSMKGLARFCVEDDPEIKMEIKAYTDILNGVKEQSTIIEAEGRKDENNNV